MSAPPPTSDLSSLAELAAAGTGDIRPLLMRAQTDLFVSAQSRSRVDIAGFEALATALLPIVDPATRAAVARQLAPHPDAPPAVVRALLRAEPEAAAAVLSLAPRLDAATIADVAEAGPAALAAAIAGRRDLSAAHVEALIDRDEAPIDEALARNDAIILARGMLDRMIARARDRAPLAALLIRRRELTGIDRAGLFAHATREERASILAEVEGYVAVEGRRRATALIDDALRDRAIGAAARADRMAFAEVLAESLGIGVSDALRLAVDPLGDLVALALIAVGIEEEDAIRIFLTLDPAIARSVERVFALAALVRSVSREAARRVVMAVLARDVAPPRRRGTHVPAVAPTGTPARAGPPRETALDPASAADREVG